MVSSFDEAEAKCQQDGARLYQPRTVGTYGNLLKIEKSTFDVSYDSKFTFALGVEYDNMSSSQFVYRDDTPVDKYIVEQLKFGRRLENGDDLNGKECLAIQFSGSLTHLPCTGHFSCSQLPESVNAGTSKKGCPGAVWSTGEPSETYCTNSASGNLYPWYKKCCEWNGSKCVPKSGTYL